MSIRNILTTQAGVVAGRATNLAKRAIQSRSLPLISANLQIPKPNGIQRFSVVDISDFIKRERGTVESLITIRPKNSLLIEASTVRLNSQLIRHPFEHITDEMDRSELISACLPVLRRDWGTILENPEAFTEEKAKKYLEGVLFNEKPYAILIYRATTHIKIEGDKKINAGDIVSFTVMTGDRLLFNQYGVINVGMIRLGSTLPPFQNLRLATLASGALYKDSRHNRSDGLAVTFVRSFQQPAIAAVVAYLENPCPPVLDTFNPALVTSHPFYGLLSPIGQFIIERYPLAGTFDPTTFIIKDAFTGEMAIDLTKTHHHRKYQTVDGWMAQLTKHDVLLAGGFVGPFAIGKIRAIEYSAKVAPFLGSDWKQQIKNSLERSFLSGTLQL